MDTIQNKGNYIIRCPECILIPSIKMKFENNEIEYECENKHKNTLSYDKFVTESKKYSFNNIKCFNCNNESDNDNYFYCFKCKNFICLNCIKEHIKNKEHKFYISITGFDGCCKEHNNSYAYYCKNCKKNICSICNNEHLTHNIEDLSKLIFNEKDEAMKEINEIKNIKNKIDIIQNNINELFNKIKNNIINKIDLINNLLYTYEYEQKYHNLNYYVINNLKSFKNNIKLNINFNSLFNKSDQLINSLKNLFNNNKLQNNIRELKNHTSSVYNIIILKDGRLSSCGGDGLINIYNKQNYNVDLQIKDKCEVFYHKELSNNNIISCCSDKTLKIYKNNNLIYTLNGHNNWVCKVIELENNKLISCAYDNTMKIWEFDGNKYNCTNTFTISNSNNWTNILRINKDKLVSSAYSSNYIKFWDIKNNFNEIKTLNNIETCYWNSMCMINDNILLIGGYSSGGIYIINTDNYQMISQVHKNIKYVYSIIELMNGNILIGCCDENNKYSLIEYKYENNDLIKILSKDNAHSSYIWGLIEMNDGMIISCSDDKSIKYWY